MQSKKCWVCGKKATVFPSLYRLDKYHFDREEYHQRGYCKECAAKVDAQNRRDKAEYIRLRKSLMYERAVRMLERQNIDIYDYEEALKAVKDFSETNLERFDSAEEMVAAAILINSEIEITVGKQIGQYTVDFYIPKMFVILEIDGQMHGNRVYYDNERDKELRTILGAKWEVVRIKTDYIAENAKMLVDAIESVYNEKKRLRKENNGFLPDWYSRREFAKKPKRQDYGDDGLIKI